MASNAYTNESLEINGSGFIQVAGNFSVKDIFQKKNIAAAAECDLL